MNHFASRLPAMLPEVKAENYMDKGKMIIQSV